MPNRSFNGLRVLSLESRRAREIEKLIVNYGGEPIVVPSVREVSLDSNRELLQFIHDLDEGQFDLVVFMTGVGVRTLATSVEDVCPRERFAELLKRVTLVARGPKPVAALKEFGVQAAFVVPEPNTSRDLLLLLDEKKDLLPLSGKRIALQEYGLSNLELKEALEQRGASVVPVCVYEWALPEDTRPLENVIESIIRGQIDVMLVASSVQIRHLFSVAESMGCPNALQDALSRVVIVSIGPLTSEELRRRGLNVDIECTRPKLGFLVQEAAEKSGELRRQKGCLIQKVD